MKDTIKLLADTLRKGLGEQETEQLVKALGGEQTVEQEIKPETICRFILDGPIRESIGLYYGKDVDGYHMEGFYNENGDFCSYAAKWDHAEPIEQREVVGKIVQSEGRINLFMFGTLVSVFLKEDGVFYQTALKRLDDRQEMELYA